MKKVFVILVVVSALGLGIGLPLDIVALASIGAIASIGAGLIAIVLFVMWIMRKAAG